MRFRTLHILCKYLLYCRQLNTSGKILDHIVSIVTQHLTRGPGGNVRRHWIFIALFPQILRTETCFREQKVTEVKALQKWTKITQINVVYNCV